MRNASEAYRFAYDCSRMTDKSIWEKASSLLSDVKVSARVTQLQSQLAEKGLITKEEIIKLNLSVINADILDFINAEMKEVVDPDTLGCIQKPVVTFQDLKALPLNKRRLIQSVKIDRSGCPVIELMDKSKAIESINRMLGYNAPEKKEVTGKDGRDLLTGLTDDELDKRIKELQKKTK